MRKVKDVIGLPVIELKHGKQIAEAKDFFVDNEWIVQGMLLEEKHWFSSPQYIAWDDIVSVGEDAITISDEHAVQSLGDCKEMHFLMCGPSKIAGLPIMTVNGKQLGTIEDVYFAEESGKRIIGYEITNGFISDLQEGRKWLRVPEKVTMGEDAIIVPVHCDHDLEEIITSTNE